MQRNILSGSEFLLYNINNEPVAYSTNCVLKINNNLSDVTTKDSDSWNEFMVGLKDWSIDFDGLVSYGNGFDTSFFLSKFKNAEPFFIKFGVVQENFTHAFFGEVHIALIEQTADNGVIATYSGSLKGVGNLSFTDEGSPEQSGYLKVETDPVFRGSPSFNITEADKTKWNEANNKILQELEFVTVGETTTLKIKFKDGNVYSSSFQNTGGTGSSINNLSFSKDNGNLTVGNLSTSLDGRYQMAGTGVGLSYLAEKFFNKDESDARYYSITNPSNFITGESETLDKVLSRGNSSDRDINISGTATFDSQLVIPVTLPEANTQGSIWVGDGATAGVIQANHLDNLEDVQISNPVNGDGLVYNNGQWINQEVASIADKNYEYTQNIPSAIWEIQHNLNKLVNVTVIDSANTLVTGSVEYINKNKITITFNAAFSGYATLN